MRLTDALVLYRRFKTTGARHHLLGLNVGTKDIGLAITTDSGGISPEGVLRRDQMTIDQISDELNAMVRNKSVCGFIMGYPLTADGNPTPMCQEIEDFVNALKSTQKLENISYAYSKERNSIEEGRRYFETIVGGMSDTEEKYWSVQCAAVVYLREYLFKHGG